MQSYADVLRMPISVIASEQGPALGSAIHAAVAAGAYPDVRGGGGGHGPRRARDVRPRRGDRRRLRRALRRVQGAARPLRSRRQRRDAPAEGDPARGAGARERGDAQRSTPTIAAIRADLVALHAKLVRYGLVVWTGGNVSRPRARRGPVRHQAVAASTTTTSTAADMILCDLDGAVVDGARRERSPLERHRRARLRLPQHAGGRRRRAHALDLRDGLGGARRGDPVRDHRDGRRVRRRDPGRPVRDHRRRLDRPRHRRDAHRPPLARRADAEPRPVHDRQATRATPSRPPSWSRTSRAPCTSPASSASRSPIPQDSDRLALRPLPERLRPGTRRENSSVTRSIIPDLTTFEVWFLTGSQGLYGEETLRQVAEPVAGGRRRAGRRRDIPVTRRLEAGAHRQRRDPPRRARGERRRPRHRR